MVLRPSSALWATALLLPAVGTLAQTATVYPSGIPYPESFYPDAVDPYAVNGTQFNQTSPPSYPSPWGTGLGNWTQAYEQARAFVAQLTLPEKVNLTTGVGWEMEKCVGNTGSIPRLNFPGLCLQDSPLGLRDTDYNSGFSSGVTVAATWNRTLFYQRGFDMGSEHRDKGTDMQLGPVVGPLGRAPEGGRNWEGFSPDPVLSGIAVYYTIQGIQAAGVMACTKHYIGYEQEHFRNGGDGTNLTLGYSSNIDDVTMHELYLWPFADAVRAGTAAVMSSYNQINNSYASQNAWTLNYLLKNELGFQGLVVSDWQGQHGGVSSALAGSDMTMPGDTTFDTGDAYWGANLTIAVLNGTVPQWRVDDMAVRIMAAYFYVDRPNNLVENAPTFSSWTGDTYGYQHQYSSQGYGQVNYHVNVQQDHYVGIRQVATEGTVLLKNNGALPLTGTEQLVTIFGSDAGENLWGPNGDSDRGGDNGTLAMGWGSGTANFPYLITPLEAIKAEVRANNGNLESVIDDYAYTQANALARKAEQVNGVCIYFGNSDSGEEFIDIDMNLGDRQNLTLWHNGNDMIANVTSQCSNTIVVIHSVGAVDVSAWYENPNVTAIIWAGLPGQESGNAITDILYGKANPGGKTPFTWGKARSDYGTDVLYELNNGLAAPQLDFEEGQFIDYRGFDEFNKTPVYEFGFGLSYTNFSFSNLQVENLAIPAYVPTTGNTIPAPTYGTVSNNTSEYLCGDLPKIYKYIYPCLNVTDLKAASGDPEYGIAYTWPEDSSSGDAQPFLRAGSSTTPGGNEGLYDVLFVVTADVTNTGAVVGDEVPQLYISLGGPNTPKVQLRNFDRITIEPSQTVQFVAEVTRRDVSNWDTNMQDWVITNYTKTIYVGNSSRNLPLSAALDFSGGSGTLPTSSVTSAPSPTSTWEQSPYPTSTWEQSSYPTSTWEQSPYPATSPTSTAWEPSGPWSPPSGPWPTSTPWIWSA